MVRDGTSNNKSDKMSPPLTFVSVSPVGPSCVVPVLDWDRQTEGSDSQNVIINVTRQDS